ncbi:alpha/beta hydrolase fold domain-containing protein [Alkalibaculum sp. M08DMB]|uniref:Alpha/beta hydrolase fold domain-containing protein n=1 Tax=Alkalibaculum sporogenes TaxID=2655001 RepID=A0A6A7K9H9_9FIRM|nr:alpha/beta hydrolase [Alkalibaculum sporogenes]MPW26084.1 alpha/beta hydrolase fold domain-containing protein [Alkalibaculum sporogenes]
MEKERSLQELFGREMPYTIEVDHIKRKFLNLSFGRHERQKLDIYLPEDGDGPFPVIIYLHGGAFKLGDKSDSQVLPFLEGIELGYAVISVNYRLSTEAKFPEPLFDIKASIRWIRAHALEYNLNPDNIALTGASAGAYYAVMTAATQDNPEFEGAYIGNSEFSSKVKVVIDWYGPTNFLCIRDHFEESGLSIVIPSPKDGVPTPEELLLGASLKDIKGLAMFTNPITYINESFPPIMIQHGKIDPIVPYQQSIILAEAIEKNGGKNQCILDIADGYSHVDTRFENKRNMKKVFDFLDTYLK